MRLLPIIIVVSILGFFLIISFTAIGCHCWRTRARRKSLSIASDDQKPPRQLTVRNGKVIPVSEIISTINASQLRSSEFGTVGSGNMLKSKFWKTGLLPSTNAANFFDLRRSSPSSDLEAQSDSSDTKEASVRIPRQLEEQLQDRRNSSKSQPTENGKRASASSRKITTSLKRAYKGAPALETVTIEIPSAPGSRPATIRTLVRKKTSSSAVTRSSKPGCTDNKPGDVTPTEKPWEQPPTAQLFVQNAPTDAIGLAVSTDAIQFDPPGFFDNHGVSIPIQLVIPRDSLATFGSSDSSPTWTFAHAQAVPILSSVTPPAAARTVARVPRSKYGRHPKLSHEKKLPIIPGPP